MVVQVNGHQHQVVSEDVHTLGPPFHFIVATWGKTDNDIFTHIYRGWKTKQIFKVLGSEGVRETIDLSEEKAELTF